MHNPSNSDDWLTRFSRFIAQLKFLVFELAIFVGFLVWIWAKLKHDLGF